MSKILSRTPFTGSLTILQLLIAFSALCIYRPLVSKDRVSIICVASDHSPVAMAMKYLAYKRGIKTCYIQHAPISSIFPPLDFDLSILYDQASYDIYSDISNRVQKEIRGKVIFLSPFDDSFRYPLLGSGPYCIGISLSYVFNPRGLEELIKELSSINGIEKIYLKPHPRCKTDLSTFLRFDRVEYYSPISSNRTYFSTIDINIVANSGIVIDSLHHGVPTFYKHDLDSIAYDYYGFVKQGIVPKFKKKYLFDHEMIGEFFDNKWLDRFSRYDYSVLNDKELSKRLVNDSIHELLNGDYL